MTRLRGVENGLESWDDVRHAFDDLVQRGIDGYRWHSAICERYVEGRLTVHLHLFTVDGHAHCVQVDALRGLAARGHRSDITQHDDDLGRLNLTDGEQRHSVLVVVGEGVEPAQRLIPSVVRLNVPDVLNGRCGDLLLRKTVKVLRKPLGRRVVVNGHLDLFTLPICPGINGGLSERGGKLPHDVIEGGSGVPEAITDDGAETERGLFTRGGCDSLVLTVRLDRERVRVLLQEHGNLGIEGVQVFLCPDDFEPRSVERMRHGKDSENA